MKNEEFSGMKLMMAAMAACKDMFKTISDYKVDNSYYSVAPDDATYLIKKEKFPSHSKMFSMGDD